MKEITFRIEHDEEKDCEKITIIEDGSVFVTEYYHKDTDEYVMLVNSALDWYNVELNDL